MLACTATTRQAVRRPGCKHSDIGINLVKAALPRPSTLFQRRISRPPARASKGADDTAQVVQQQTTPKADVAANPQDSNAAPANAVTKSSQLLAEVVASPIFYLAAGLAAIGIVSNLGENQYGIFFLAAAPVTFLTALSKSSIGKSVQDDLEARLPELQAAAEKVAQQHQQARQRSPWYGEARPRWGGASHLKGQVAGDYGFDPLGLASESEKFRWNYEAELLHARWAMMAAVGCLIPEALSLAGVELGEPVWWKVGAEKLKGDLTLNWGGIEGFRIAGKQGIAVIAACQVVLMGGPEYARYVGIKSLEPVGVFLPGEQNYPGGQPFDPFNYSQDADGFVDQAVKEIKNGRLAMVAMLGYFVQAAVTRQGPLQNLLDFVADPVHNNITAYL